MTENRMRARAERGEIQIGTWITMIRTPGVLTLLQAAGLDFARIDMKKESLQNPVQQLTISLDGTEADTGVLKVAWENTQVSVDFKVK